MKRWLVVGLLAVFASAVYSDATAELVAISEAVPLLQRAIEPVPGPRVAGLANGSFVVAWTTDSFTDDQGSIRAQMFDPTGTALGEIINVSTLVGAHDNAVDVGVMPNGQVVLVWLRVGDPDRILLRLMSESGSFMTDEIVVNDASHEPRPFTGDVPRVGVGSNTEFVVVWANQEVGSPWAQRFDAAGIRIGPNFSGIHREESGDDAAAAYTSDNDFVVGWTVSYHVGGYCDVSNGSFVGATMFSAGVPQTLKSEELRHPINSPTAPYQPTCWHAMGGKGFDLTADRRGRLVIAADGYYPGYFDYGSYPHYYIEPYLDGVFAERMSTRAGTRRNGQLDKVDGHAGLDGLAGLSVADTRRGHYIVAWSRTYDQDPTAGRNYVQEVRLSGFGCDGSQESPLQFRVDTDATRHQYDVDVAATGDSTFIVTWVRRLLNDKKQILAQPFAVTGDCDTCGDANNDLRITAVDALLVLDAAVGLRACDAEVCDVNADGSVQADDALIVLLEAIGIGGNLQCTRDTAAASPLR